MGGPTVGMPIKAPENYASTLNSNSQTNVSPTNLLYHATMASKNMFTAIMRHGLNTYRHVMTAAFDPIYGREFSLAYQHERPATRFPLAETTRPNERSENVNLVSLLGGFYIKPNEVNPFQNTVIIYNASGQGKKGQEGPYKPYAENYHGNYRKKDEKPTNKNPLRVKRNTLYKIESIAKAVEQRGREYFRRFNNAHHNKEQRQRGFYESRGIGEKVAYLGQKLKGYAGKVTGYNSQSKPQEQVSVYEGQDTKIPNYILPTSYAGTNTQPTSIDEKLMEQEIQVPQDVLDATITDAEEFLRQMRIKDSDPANASGLDLIVLK